jgi:hypothetical protein
MNNTYDKIAAKAYELAYSLTFLIREEKEGKEVPWMVFHGMSVALTQFASLLYDRKACEQWQEELSQIMWRSPDLRCSLDAQSDNYSVEQARALADYAQHVFYCISRKQTPDQEYLDILLNVARKADPRNKAA